MKFKSVQDMIRAAVENKRLQIELKVQIGDEETDLVLRGIDEYNFERKRSLLEQQLRAEAGEKGLVGSELPDDEWAAYLSTLDESSRKLHEAGGKFTDRATLFVAKFMGYGLLFNMIPDCLYTKDGKKFLQSSEDQANFAELMRRDPVIINTLSTAYVSLVQMVRGVAEQAKNSSAPTMVENGTSGAYSPSDIQNTDTHSQSD